MFLAVVNTGWEAGFLGDSTDVRIFFFIYYDSNRNNKNNLYVNVRNK